MSQPNITNYTLDDLAGLLPPRALDANKGDFGHVLVIGGNHGMAGAARLAAEAAARTGAGRVSVATRASHAAFLGSSRPELMVHAIESVAELQPLLENASVIVLGPGLGQDAWSREMFAHAMRSTQPKVLDADALRQLETLDGCLPPEVLLTPHPGEAARLLSLTPAQIQATRSSSVLSLRQRFGGTWLLKGEGSLIACDTALWRCTHGHPGMASGGMGDLLCGILAALMAQGLSTCDAARLGVALHAAAGERAAQAEGGRGVLALDLLPHVRRLLEEICPC
ncbi:MAG: NAD(P)H-hydrate dehydratase [Gammaproteobacteria bacterium 28-57-27]|nr:MAG: NAD(P)H-hydrate dehydratase [Gammaproteobacteria bacterium 28-57-27]